MTNPRFFVVLILFLACGCTDRRPKDKVTSVGSAADINLVPKAARTKEQEAESASVRVHGEGDKGMQSLEEIIADFYDLNNVEKLAAKAHQEAAIEIKHHEAIEHAVPDARE